MEELMGINACIDYQLLEYVIPQFQAQKLLTFTNIVKEMAEVEI